VTSGTVRCLSWSSPEQSFTSHRSCGPCPGHSVCSVWAHRAWGWTVGWPKQFRNRSAPDRVAKPFVALAGQGNAAQEEVQVRDQMRLRDRAPLPPRAAPSPSKLPYAGSHGDRTVGGSVYDLDNRQEFSYRNQIWASNWEGQKMLQFPIPLIATLLATLTHDSSLTGYPNSLLSLRTWCFYFD
jgi:hypothetical protein